MLEFAPAEQDFFWDDLLEFFDERRVIPVVGAERLNVPNGAREACPPAVSGATAAPAATQRRTRP